MTKEELAEEYPSRSLIDEHIKSKSNRLKMGTTIESLRKQMNLTRPDFIKLVKEKGYSKLTLGKLESCEIGRAPFQEDLLEVISKCFRKTVEELISLAKEKEVDTIFEKQKKRISPLRNRRKELKMKQIEVSRIANIKQGSIAHFETGRHEITGRSLASLAEALNIPAEFISCEEKWNKYIASKNIKMTMGERIQKRRKELNLTQRQLAKETGITYRKFLRIETESIDISIEEGIVLCDILSVSSDYLLGKINVCEDLRFIEIMSSLSNLSEDTIQILYDFSTYLTKEGSYNDE